MVLLGTGWFFVIGG